MMMVMVMMVVTMVVVVTTVVSWMALWREKTHLDGVKACGLDLG